MDCLFILRASPACNLPLASGTVLHHHRRVLPAYAVLLLHLAYAVLRPYCLLQGARLHSGPAGVDSRAGPAGGGPPPQPGLALGAHQRVPAHQQRGGQVRQAAHGAEGIGLMSNGAEGW